MSQSVSTSPATVLERRRIYAENRLSELKRRIAGIPQLRGRSDLSIYVTGSYGRLEAGEHSDLDLFFISKGEDPPKIDKILIDAELIKIARQLKLPEFSGDGKYLQVHRLADMLNQLGGSEDDYKNYFTARLLLLLESRPIHNDVAYNFIVQSILDAYFRDYHDHVRDFRPIFLVNDILRFWKTLCLNYENRRNIRTRDKHENNKHHVRNLKLKFSRLLICFSTVIPLSAMPSTSPEEIFALTQLPPLDRLTNAVKAGKSTRLLQRIKQDYCWFLEISAKPDLENWIENRRNRRSAFRKADEFGALMYKLMVELLRNSDNQRFLII